MITNDTVRHLVNFLQTGDRRHFEAFWADAEAFVERCAASWLRNHLVIGPDGAADHNAVSDVKQGVVFKILNLPAKSNKAGWFDPVRFGWSPDCLRAWLSRVTTNTAADYCKLFHNLGDKAGLVTFSDLELNDGPNVESLLKPAQKVDFDAFELREIVAECLGELSTPQQTLYKQLFVEGLSQHEVARRTGVSPATVCRHWQDAAELLETKLRDRGVDGSWFDHAA